MSLRTAAVISIGDELTFGQSVDTNSAWIAAQLAAHGWSVVEHRTLDDERARIADAFRELSKRAELVISTGGLGPTADDLTRLALGDVVTPDEPLVEDAKAAERLYRWFAKGGRPMPENNRAQIMRPRTARCLKNKRGTAPGLAAEIDACRVYCLPGPTREMQPMFDAEVLSTLSIGDDQLVWRSRMVHAFGLSESEAAERLGQILERGREPLVGITAGQSIISARIRTRSMVSMADEKLEVVAQDIEQRWSPWAFGRDDEELSQQVGRLLREPSKTLVTAESCTGGLLGGMIVDVAGSSSYYVGGWTTYSNAMKHEQLGVPTELLAQHGAVSEPVASAMAIGALRASSADYSLAITGVAGPDDSESKPAGLVYIALGERGSDRSPFARVRRFQFSGDRSTVRDRSAKSALQMLRLRLIDAYDETELLWETPISITT